MNIYELLGVESSVAITIISIGLMLFLGFLMTRVTKKLRLPNVTAYIVTGILIGPYVLNLIPREVVTGMDFLADIALAFIAFSTGEFFKFAVLKKNGMKVVIITLFESLLASILIFVVTFFFLKMNLAFSIVLAALAAATAPASTVMTIRQTGAKGDFVDTLIQVVALDDVVGLVAYSIAISIAVASQSGGAISIVEIGLPILQNLAMVVVGGLFGYILKFLLTSKRSKDNKLIITLAFIFLFCGIAAIFDISPLLGCMAMGTVYINVTDDDKLFKTMNYFAPPILLLFFVRSGVNFNLSALVNTSTFAGTVPLIVIGIVYFIVRIIGKYFGAYTGAAIAGKSKEVKNYLGLGLIPQAGVAIGLAALGARVLGGEQGQALETIILASSVLYELIGPACAKLSLYLSRSYHREERLKEQVASAPLTNPLGETKQNELAFTEAAIEHQEVAPVKLDNDSKIPLEEVEVKS
ncbi:cation:proton antiporter [Acholeplasma equirhinis]|uniref:cation:proton antiporter n=1 Tax=Acholeplasma equirhinis TaxID=555393 RepID=UPI00197A7103|nr:cation:proton antiporter [Acholeplasma equirhinis]MBN3489915.1 cation:proton antiporter [Acholeplasma equirhinis]